MLLASGYIAGGTLIGLIIAFFFFLPDNFNKALNLSRYVGTVDPRLASLVMFLILAAILLWIGSRKATTGNGTNETPNQFD